MQTLITIKETLIVGKVKSPTPTQNAGDTAAGSSVLPTAQQPTAG